MNALDDYLSKHRIRNAAFAEMIGVSQATVSRMRNGKQGLNFEVLSRITRATKGAVTPNDFLEEAPHDPTSEGAAA